MRTFKIVRYEDPNGMSGTGTIAEGVLFSDGYCVTHWLGEWPKTETWHNVGVSDLRHIVTHGGTTDTRLVWGEEVPKQHPVSN